MDATSLTTGFQMKYTLAAGGGTGIDIPQIAMLVLAVGALTLVMLSTRRRIRNSQRMPRPSARDRYAQLQERSEATRDVEQVMLELDQVSRQIHGRLDTKLARLEAVIRDADERIDKLSRLVRRVEADPRLEITLDQEDPHETPTGRSDDADDRHAAVFTLADRGMSSVEIAREIGKPPGEIELILALRTTKAEACEPSSSSTPLEPRSR